MAHFPKPFFKKARKNWYVEIDRKQIKTLLKPFHVEEWVDGYEIAQTTRRNYFRNIKRCLSWAKRQGRIEENPLEALDVPGGERRDVYVPLDEFERLLTYVLVPAFRIC